ncbi:MAG TPA: hypothetical protein V6C72_08160, partial [Chroococcales cyanobacterium]
MTTTDADNTVKKVEQIDHAVGDQGGAQHAYDELKKEHDQYASTHSAADTKTYWDSVTSQLQKDNVLPDLAVAWGKENFAGFSSDGKNLNGYNL